MSKKTKLRAKCKVAFRGDLYHNIEYQITFTEGEFRCFIKWHEETKSGGFIASRDFISKHFVLLGKVGE